MRLRLGRCRKKILDTSEGRQLLPGSVTWEDRLGCLGVTWIVAWALPGLLPGRYLGVTWALPGLLPGGTWALPGRYLEFYLGITWIVILGCLFL